MLPVLCQQSLRKVESFLQLRELFASDPGIGWELRECRAAVLAATKPISEAPADRAQAEDAGFMR